jgi:hypothetical protein
MLDDVLGLMARLAARRPVLHSEADFQHELAWEARDTRIANAVRLELPHQTPDGRIAVDVVLSCGAARLGVELKYWKRRFTADVAGESFDLRNQGAHDLARYDLWSDVARLERLVDGGTFTGACAIALTNDPAYWNVGANGTIDAAFRLHEGRNAEGTLAWAAHAGAGTTRGRAAPIDLRRHHTVRWHDYSVVADHRFRWCAFTIEPAGNAAR